MTSAGSWNPFLRDTRFTNPIAESEKAHAEAEDVTGGPIIGVGSSAAAHAGSELTMVEVLEKLKAAIRLRGGDNGIKTLSRILKRMDTSGDGAVRVRARARSAAVRSNCLSSASASCARVLYPSFCLFWSRDCALVVLARAAVS